MFFLFFGCCDHARFYFLTILYPLLVTFVVLFCQARMGFFWRICCIFVVFCSPSLRVYSGAGDFSLAWCLDTVLHGFRYGPVIPLVGNFSISGGCSPVLTAELRFFLPPPLLPLRRHLTPSPLSLVTFFFLSVTPPPITFTVAVFPSPIDIIKFPLFRASAPRLVLAQLPPQTRWRILRPL